LNKGPDSYVYTLDMTGNRNLKWRSLMDGCNLEKKGLGVKLGQEEI